MYEQVPEHLREEARIVEAEIRAAFKGVSRAGGISWSGTRLADDHESDEEVRAAAELDTESCWEDLVDDPAWRHDMGVGGFLFLDAIGLRYYIAPAMIRALRSGDGEQLDRALVHEGDGRRGLVTILSREQLQTVIRFIRLMIAVSNSTYGENDWTTWAGTYDLHWKKFDTGGLTA